MSSIKDRAIMFARVGLASAALYGCGDADVSIVKIQTPAASERLMGKKPASEIFKDTLRSGGYSEKESVEYVSPVDNKVITFSNFTDYSLNTYAVTGVYNAAENMMPVEAVSINVKVLGEDKLLLFKRRPAERRTVFIIPKNTYVEAIGVQDVAKLQRRDGYTLLGEETREYLTVLRDGTSFPRYVKNYQEYLTVLYAIEACQQLATAGIFETSGETNLTRANTIFAQELFCNSVGLAIGSAAVGKNYSEYFEEASGKFLNFGPGYRDANLGDYPYVIVPEGLYNLFPKTGAIVGD